MRLIDKTRYLFLVAVLCSGPVTGAITTILYKGGQDAGSLSLLQMLNGFFCVLLFVFLPLKKNDLKRNMNVLIPLFFFFLFVFFTAPLREYQLQNFVYCFRLVFLILIFLSFHLLARDGAVDIKTLRLIAWVVLISVVLSQYFGRSIGLNTKSYGLEFVMGGLGGKVSTLSGYLASIVPIFFLGDKVKKLDLFGFGLLIISAILTFKRTLWIAICLVLLLYFIKLFYSFSLKGRVKVLFLFTVLVSCIYYILYHTPIGVEVLYRLADLDVSGEGTGSGRVQIWSVASSYFYNMDAFHTLVGYGAGHLPDIMYVNIDNAIGAHNDWLDIAVSYGVIGLIIFFWFFISMARFAINLFMLKNKYYLTVLSCLVIMLFYSFATGGVFNITFAVLFGVLGFCSGRDQWIRQKHLSSLRDCGSAVKNPN